MVLATRLPFPPPALKLSSPLHHKYRTTTFQVRLHSKPAPPQSSSSRREILISTGLLVATAATAAAEEEEEAAEPAAATDTTITDRVFLDITMCPTSFKPERTASSTNNNSSAAAPASPAKTAAAVAESFCPEGEPLGRIVIGLYGKQVPRTVANFKAMCTGTSGSKYEGTLIHKIFPGQYFMAGKQGRREKGEVPPPANLQRNTETVEARAFKLRHLKPGTVSLCLSENDDEEQYKLTPDYRNVEFMVTIGPGPCPQLDNANIVFGTVLEGMDVVTAIAAIPTYKPGERIRQFNDLAEFLGDERAQNARNIWNRPLKNIFISSSGELRVAKPSLAPSLP
ncbi:hypothetical protein SUGI_0890130 [Cryptomeria japonica]|uniref:peptidyl-prolyl cis-trans isomerase CYP28, chloroplastic n=1 Tax=Cryptomeria japonica TaxID=3369 RepID=UPI0024147530|nr:peptidyl-prolyl cis-trans isomerase CYP28, chloroplastic [Cryptomeria japonica]GLJ42917.1 hypothetical protein SUGI_0890130 [Cryptomeria japonica]